MKKLFAKRLLAMAMTACMVLPMLTAPASALTTHDLKLTITEANATGSDGKTTVTAQSSDVSLQADLTTELVALLVSQFEGDAKNNKSGLWDFESDEMGLTIERGLAANRKGETEWFAWLDTFAAKDTIQSGTAADDKGSLVTLLKNKNLVGAMTVNKDYILTYAPTENLKPGDPAIGNTYTFTMRLNRTITGGGGGISGGSGGGSTAKDEYTITVNDSANAVVSANATKAQAGTKITVTVKTDEGYAVDTVAVRQQGAAGLLTVTDNGDGTYVFTMPAGAVTVTVTTKAKPVTPVDPYDPSAPGHNTNCPASRFDDVNLNEWYHRALDYVLSNGLMAGYNATNFGTNDSLSRAMVAQLFYNMEGQPKGNYENKFPDVEENMWYRNAISWAYTNGVVSGYGDGLYRPNKDVSREELVQIFCNYAKAKGLSDGQRIADLTSFVDYKDIASWHEVAVSWGVGSGLLGGKGGNIMAPKMSATRAEAAQILMSFCLKVKK